MVIDARNLLAAGVLLVAAPDDPFQGQDPAALRALILPTEAESDWLRIPWRTSLWEARRVAAREGKPILLWEMDGNPLGCT